MDKIRCVGCGLLMSDCMCVELEECKKESKIRIDKLKLENPNLSNKDLVFKFFTENPDMVSIIYKMRWRKSTENWAHIDELDLGDAITFTVEDTMQDYKQKDRGLRAKMSFYDDFCDIDKYNNNKEE